MNYPLYICNLFPKKCTMYKLAEFLKDVIGIDFDSDYGVFCIENDLYRTSLINKMTDTLDCYTFTVVINGNVAIIHNGIEVRLSEGDLFCYTPGADCTVVGGTADFRSYCLLADESLTYSSPVVRLMIRAAYFPTMELSGRKITLAREDAQRMENLMRGIIDYQQRPHRFKRDALSNLYNLFLLDFMDIQERSVHNKWYSERTGQLFTEFIQLAQQHFTEHRDLTFYATQLHITPIYLSRIVKRITGDTVVNYLNRLLLMEATYLLQTSGATVAQIAETLHFADQASFSKFFTRMRGIGPKQFRMIRDLH